jgi:hypothetical protein
MGDTSSAYTVLVWNLRETDHLDDLGLDERIILKWVFEKWYGEAWI